MTYKAKQNWKDLTQGPKHQGLTRRDLLRRGFATAALSMTLPGWSKWDLIRRASASALLCPTPTRSAGSIAQIFAQGGPTMGARFISEAQAAMMNAGMAANYGVSGQTNLVKIGPNLVVDSTSPFGFTLLQGPLGYPGGVSAWRTNVLNKISGGGHLGPFNSDDGAGQDTGLLGGVSPFKTSEMGKDLKIGVSNKLAAWANGSPAASVSRNNLSPTSLANLFTLTPAANGLINAQALTAASDTANGIAQDLAPVLKNDVRNGSQTLTTNTGCAIYGNSALADPNYGNGLFNPTQISGLANKLTITSLSNQEQAQVAAFYQSAVGVAGGVILEFGGRDYHGQDPATVIAPADIEEARTIVMFLAACDLAGAPGAMIYLANGQAIAAGVQAVTATINGATANINAPIAKGDAGGAYNAGLILFYDPKGSPPAAKFTGALTGSSGNVKTDPAIGSSGEAVAGLYLSALSWISGGTIPQAALQKMQASGVARSPTSTMVI